MIDNPYTDPHPSHEMGEPERDFISMFDKHYHFTRIRCVWCNGLIVLHDLGGVVIDPEILAPCKYVPQPGGN